MFFDARKLTRFVNVNGKLSSVKSKFEYEGNGLILRCADVKMFGGAKRLSVDLKGNVIAREPSLVPMTMRDPYRMMEGRAFRIMTHLVMDKLPKGIVARIAPVPVVAETGLIFAEEYVREGELWVTAYTLRRIELDRMFPFAMLLFIPEEIKEEKPKPKAKATAVKQKSAKDKEE